MITLSAFSGDDHSASLLARWRDRSPGTPAAVLVYEQFVVRNPDAPLASRLLQYDPALLARELERLKKLRLLRPGDLLVRNTEHGHPADGPAMAAVHHAYADDLRRLAARYACHSGAYGLFKMRVWKEHGVKALHLTGPKDWDISDGSAASVVALDDFAVAEIYCYYASNPDTSRSNTAQERLSLAHQRRWMREQVRDVMCYSSKPVLALGHPFYLDTPVRGRPLHSFDRRAVENAALSVEGAGWLALWAHCGRQPGGFTAEAILTQAREWSIPGFTGRDPTGLAMAKNVDLAAATAATPSTPSPLRSVLPPAPLEPRRGLAAR